MRDCFSQTPIEEIKVWKIVKNFPNELGFIIQEPDYQKYCETFYGQQEEIKLTEEQFNIVKNYFTKRGF